MSKKNLIYILLMLLLCTQCTTHILETSHKEFEKKYLEFHERYDNGYDPTITEIDSIFKDCPDLTRFPHFFIYKGDLLGGLGYDDLSVQYYFEAEKYITLGYESKQLEDHKPIMYFKLANTYFHLGMFKEMKTYIDKLKLHNQENYSFHSEFDYNELLAIYWFHFEKKKKQAIQLLKDLYQKAGKHKNSPVFKIRNTVLMKAIDMALQIKDYKEAKYLLNMLQKKEPWFKKVDGYLLRWYYRVHSEYYVATQKLQQALAYNDSIYTVKPLKLEHKTALFRRNVNIYTLLENKEKVAIYKDSLRIISNKTNKSRIDANLRLTKENQIFENQINRISKQKTDQKWYWFLSVFCCLVAIVVIITLYRKKKRASEKEYQHLSSNYEQLLKNYQFTNKQLNIIKNSLQAETHKPKDQKSNQLYHKINQYNFLKTNEDLLTLDTIRDQFIMAVKEEFPNISNAVLLILFYTKTGLSSKEISTMLKLTTRSVESYKYRFGKQLKKELNITLKAYLEKTSVLEKVI